MAAANLASASSGETHGVDRAWFMAVIARYAVVECLD